MVRGKDGDEEWTLSPTRLDGDWSIELRGSGLSWTGTGPSCFHALRDLRVQLDKDGFVVGLNGARPECTVSGMLADMGEGRSVYVLAIDTAGRPDTVRTLDPAPLDSVTTVAEQDAFAKRWHIERRTRSTTAGENIHRAAERPALRETTKDPVRLLLFLLAMVCVITGVVLLPGGTDSEIADLSVPAGLIAVGGGFVLALVLYAKRRM